MRYFSALCLLLLILCATIMAGAQSTDATVSGVVVDPSGKVIQDADIEILNEATGLHYSSKTNDDGIYTVTILPPGQYRVQVSKIGFKTLIKSGIVLNVQSAVALNFTLPVGATSESVTVEAGAQTINTNDASVSTVIDRTFVANMPLNGRSFQDLLTLAPGVSQTPSSYGSYGTGYSGDIVVNGQRTEANYFTVDGVSANTGSMAGQFGGGAGPAGSVPGLTALGTTQSMVSIDDLQEFRATTSTYSAEYGRTPGGQFSFSTRSGTNLFHGSTFDYFRNDALDASNWFNDYYGYPKGKERQNDFGGTFGGPLMLPGIYNGRNKTFFFLSYEGLRLDSPQAATTVYVPDNCLRGVASACATTGGSSAPTSLQPLLNAFPIANGGEDGFNDGFAYYIESVSYPSALDNTSIRIDHKFGERFSIFGRYADSPSNTTSYNAAVEQATGSTSHVVTLGTSYILTSHQSNALRFNFTQSGGISSQQSTSLGGAVPLDLTSLPGPNDGSFPATGSQLYAVFTYAGFTQMTLGVLPNNQHQFNITDTHYWELGRHNLKAGVDWRRVATLLAPMNPQEEIGFTDESEVLLNSPAVGEALVQAGGDVEPLYLNMSSFVQDEWKATSRLALSLGFRWDINPAPTDAKGPVPYTVTQVTNLATTQLAPLGTPLWKTDWIGFAPRLGVAYQLSSGSERSAVLRAGFGVFYDLGNTRGSSGYEGIGYATSQNVSSPSFPLTSEQLTVPAPSISTPYNTAVYGFDPNLRLPYSLQYNLALEQQLSHTDSLTINYVGSGGRRLLTNVLTYPGAYGNPNFASSTVLQVTQGRASSSYNSLQAKYQRNLARGLQALVSYTWSHSIDDASNNFSIFYLLRASSDFDIRQNLQAAITYLTPRLKSSSKTGQLLDDWGIDGRFQARTALPVDVIGNQQLNAETGIVTQFQPDLVSGEPLYLYGSGYPGRRIINYNDFQTAAPGVQGNLPRNYARGFGAVQLDTAVRREIPVHDRLHLLFRAEAFNIANHPQFGSIYNYLAYGPGYFGYAYSTLNSDLGSLNSLYQVGGPRSLQFSLKVLF